MNRIRIQKARAQDHRPWLEVLTLARGDPDVVRAKALAVGQRDQASGRCAKIEGLR